MKYLPDDIIKEWGLSNLSSEEQVSAIEKINRILFQAILARSLDLLIDEEQDELDKMLDDNDMTPDKILIFLSEKIPTYEAIRLEEIESLKRDILVHS